MQVEPVTPPPRPSTVPLALQQHMPLGVVLDIIAKPPGSAPPFIPYKPVPHLVPLPTRHAASSSAGQAACRWLPGDATRPCTYQHSVCG